MQGAVSYVYYAKCVLFIAYGALQGAVDGAIFVLPTVATAKPGMSTFENGIAWISSGFYHALLGFALVIYRGSPKICRSIGFIRNCASYSAFRFTVFFFKNSRGQQTRKLESQFSQPLKKATHQSKRHEHLGKPIFTLFSESQVRKTKKVRQMS